MDDAAEMAERHGAALKTLAERALALACALQERAMAAETGAEMAELALAFQRVGRAVRQSVALEAKLVRDRERAEREARAEAAREDAAGARRRKGQLRTVLRRMIFDEGATVLVPDDEADEDDADEVEVWDEDTEDRLVRLETLLDAGEFDDGFAAAPVADQIERLRRDLGMAQDALAEATIDDAPDGAGPGARPNPIPPAWPLNGHPPTAGEGASPGLRPPNSS